MMHGRQVGVSGYHPPPNQPPMLSPPTQEDLFHLPGRLRINPSLWDKDDVSHWLHWAQREYSLCRPEKGHFEMNGRALCLLTKEDFRLRCPNSGDVLYEILQCVKRQRRSVVSEFLNASSSMTTGTVQNTSSRQISTQKMEEPQDPPTDDSQVLAATVWSEASQSEQMSPLFCPNPLTRSVLISTPKQVHRPPAAESINQEPLNLSSRDNLRSPTDKANGRMPDCRLLWDYVYQLLCDDRYQGYIRWEDQSSLVFRVVDPSGLARLWGNHKNRDNMTYEKMSRALRHYYKLNIIKKERGQKLLFRFLKSPQDIRKQQADPPDSPEHTPPQDRDFSDFSHTNELHIEHFEVSPDRASPPFSPAPPVR